MSAIERRTTIELRAGGGKTPRLEGYAAVFDSLSEDLGGFREIIKPGAFTRTLASNRDPLALVAHMPALVLGRRSANTLRLSQDSRGLAFDIDVPNTTAARDLLISVERGDIKGCSFGFTTPKGGDTWRAEGARMIRTLTDLDLHEITVTANPAYTDTTVALRALNGLPRTYAFRLGALQRFLASC